MTSIIQHIRINYRCIKKVILEEIIFILNIFKLIYLDNFI